MVNTEMPSGQRATACVTLLAESVAQLPCELYRRDAQGGRDRATDHPLYDVIHSQPNQKDTSFEYYEQAGCLRWKVMSSPIQRDGAGYPTELIPVHLRKCACCASDGLPYYQLLDYKDQIPPMRSVHHVMAARWLCGRLAHRHQRRHHRLSDGDRTARLGSVSAWCHHGRGD